MSEPSTSSSLSNGERRRLQNRRAQANLRKKRQEELQDLHQQIEWLKAQSTNGQQGGEAQGYSYSTSPANPSLLSIQDSNFPGIGSSSVSLHHPSITYSSTSLSRPTSLEEQRIDTHYSTVPVNDTTAHLPNRSSQTLVQTRTRPDQPTLICAFDALARNATLLNISSESFLSANSESPFFTPWRMTNIDAVHLPCSLRPTVTQTIYPHHPWIDCIPLTDFRSRTILATSCRPPLIDGLELWHDVLSDGLYCRGDPENPAAWEMSDDFANRWHSVLTTNLNLLEAMCLTSNPPLPLMKLAVT